MIGGVRVAEAAHVLSADLLDLKLAEDPNLRRMILEEIASRGYGEAPEDLVSVLEEVARDLRLH
jgi:hypothetical protein